MAFYRCGGGVTPMRLVGSSNTTGIAGGYSVFTIPNNGYSKLQATTLSGITVRVSIDGTNYTDLSVSVGSNVTISTYKYLRFVSNLDATVNWDITLS